MKRLGCIGLTIMICAGMLAGCGSSLEADHKYRLCFKTWQSSFNGCGTA